MTIEEKSKYIENYCNQTICDQCPLNGCNGACYENPSTVEKNYEKLIASGKAFPPKRKEINVNIEDADAVIAIRSNKDIDNISIYFREEK